MQAEIRTTESERERERESYCAAGSGCDAREISAAASHNIDLQEASSRTSALSTR